MKKFVMTVAAVAALAIAGSANAASMLSDHNGVNLRKGSTGTRVMELQACMNAAGYNTGVVDGIFGSNTKAGVMTFQASKGLVVDGIVGFNTTPAFQAACMTEMSDDMMSEDDSESTFSSSTGEEADVTIEDTSKEDDLNNDEKGQHAFSFEVEADEDGGDAQIERVDLQFTITQAGTGEDDVYDIIEAVTIEVNGDEVAEESSDDDDDWRGAGDDILRLSGLDTVVESDETVEFDVLLDIADLDQADDLDTPNGITIELTSIEIRYTDEAGITDTVSTTDAVDVDIEALDAIEFDVDESNDNPDQDETVSLDEDVDGVVAFVNDVTVDEQDGVLEKVTVAFLTSSDLSAEDIDDLVNEVTLDFDGEEIEADDINALTATGFTVEFDMDDMDIEVDDEFEVTVTLDLEELEDGSAFIGEDITADTITFEGEDQEDDDFTVVENVDNGIEISLSAGALKLEDSSVDGYNEVGSDDNAAKAVFEIEVKADGDEDIRVDSIVFELDGVSTTIALAASTTSGDYTIEMEDGNNDDVTGAFEINDGSSETFEITVFLDNNGGAAGEFSLELDEVMWTEDTLGNGFASGTTAGTLEVSLEADDIDLVS